MTVSNNSSLLGDGGNCMGALGVWVGILAGGSIIGTDGGMVFEVQILVF